MLPIGLTFITIFRLVEAATQNKFLWIDDAWVTGYLGNEKYYPFRNQKICKSKLLYINLKHHAVRVVFPIKVKFIREGWLKMEHLPYSIRLGLIEQLPRELRVNLRFSIEYIQLCPAKAYQSRNWSKSYHNLSPCASES